MAWRCANLPSSIEACRPCSYCAGTKARLSNGGWSDVTATDVSSYRNSVDYTGASQLGNPHKVSGNVEILTVNIFA